MAKVTSTSTSGLAIKIKNATAANPANVSIRLAPGVTGTVYIESNDTADVDTSFYITNSDVFSITGVDGDTFNVVSEANTEIRVFGPKDAEYGDA